MTAVALIATSGTAGKIIVGISLRHSYTASTHTKTQFVNARLPYQTDVTIYYYVV